MAQINQIKSRLAGNTAPGIDGIGLRKRQTVCQQVFFMSVEHQGGQAGKAWSALQYAGIDIGKPFDIDPQGRSWPDKTDVSAQNVPQLRQFVQTGAPQDPAQAGDAGCLVATADAVIFGTCSHGAELAKPECLLGAVHPFGPVKNRAALANQQRRNDYHRWKREQDGADHRQGHVKQALRWGHVTPAKTRRHSATMAAASAR